MGTELFSLCWNNFHTNLSTGFHSLFQGEHLVDVTLAAEGRILKAHKMVLSVCSPYFNELFRENPCKHPIVFLKDVSASALDQLLTFMYRGEVSVRHDELNAFIKTGEALQIKGLTGHSSSSYSSTDMKETQLNGTSHMYMDSVQNLSRDGPCHTYQNKKRQRSQMLTSTANATNTNSKSQSSLLNLAKLKNLAPNIVGSGGSSHLDPVPVSLLQPAVFSLNNPGTSARIPPVNTGNSGNHDNLDENIADMPAAKRSCPSSITSSDKEDHSSFPVDTSYVQSVTPSLKQEPVDEPDDYNDTSQFSDGTTIDDSMDATALLETKVSIGGDLNLEQSSSSSSVNTGWTPIKVKQFNTAVDMSTPGVSGNQPLKFMTSARGLPVLAYAGHMYTLDERKNNKTIWVCVKRRKLNCQGCVTTTSYPSTSPAATTTGNNSVLPDAAALSPSAGSGASTSSGGGKGKAKIKDGCDKDGGGMNTSSTPPVPSAPKIISYCGHNHSHLNDIIERIQAKDCISVTPKT